MMMQADIRRGDQFDGTYIANQDRVRHTKLQV